MPFPVTAIPWGSRTRIVHSFLLHTNLWFSHRVFFINHEMFVLLFGGLSSCCLLFEDKASCSPGWSQTHNVSEADCPDPPCLCLPSAKITDRAPCWGLSLGLWMPRKHFTDRATFLAVNYVFVRKCQPLSFLENYIYLLCVCMCVGGPMHGGVHVEVRRPSWWLENLWELVFTFSHAGPGINLGRPLSLTVHPHSLSSLYPLSLSRIYILIVKRMS